MDNCLILVAGMPATGKTTFASYLSARLHVPMVSKDFVKERLYDAVGFRSRAEKVKLGAAAMQIMYDFADSCLSAGTPVILENNFETQSKPGLRALAEKHGCRVLTVLFTGDPQVIYGRFAARDRSPGRHRGHVVNTQYPERPGGEPEPPRTTCAQFLAAMEARGMVNFDGGGSTLRVDTTDFQTVSYPALLSRIKEMLRGFEDGT